MMEGSSSSYDAPALEMRPCNIKNGLKDSNTQHVNKNSRKENFLCKINTSFLKNSGKPVNLSHLTSLPTHYSIDPHHRAQLINQCTAILEIIDHALPKALLNRTVHTIAALKDHNNKKVLTFCSTEISEPTTLKLPGIARHHILPLWMESLRMMLLSHGGQL